MLLGIPYNQLTFKNHENLYRGHESLLQSWPDLSDPTVTIAEDPELYKII